ncbi:hypothetical protein F5B20DRAFT_559072 [Whalleya microplaca]|nr:hypothetical protein F5B20DRAFT_559072 [Whalleya microplaca]
MENECYYELEGPQTTTSRRTGTVRILATKAFPCCSNSILEAISELIRSENEDAIQWLDSHAAEDFLDRNESELPDSSRENTSLWICYQALVFGFYYRLLEPLVDFKFLSEESYLQGVWGKESTAFLAMCTHFGRTLGTQHQKVRRTHVLYMLATMFAGRQKRFTSQSRTSLVGILGQISILALPLHRCTDTPQELAKYVVLDLPIVQLMPEQDGELYPGSSLGIRIMPTQKDPMIIHPHGTDKEWSIHPTMGNVFRNGGSGVVMAASCDGRLVGWFNPNVADSLFLSSAYQVQQHDAQSGPELAKQFVGFEVVDEDWKKGTIWRPSDSNCFGIVHSSGCPALRYAAAGFYGASGEEVAIATNGISEAFGRVEAQESGIIIA